MTPIPSLEAIEQVITAWAFAHDIDGAARNDLFKRLRAMIDASRPQPSADAEIRGRAIREAEAVAAHEYENCARRIREARDAGDQIGVERHSTAGASSVVILHNIRALLEKFDG